MSIAKQPEDCRAVDETEVVTQELIEALQSPAGAWSRKNLAFLGVSWPPVKGWKQRILGKPRRSIADAGDKGQWTFTW